MFINSLNVHSSNSISFLALPCQKEAPVSKKNELADGLVSIAPYHSWQDEVMLMKRRQTEIKVFRIRNKGERIFYLVLFFFFFFFFN